jgi:hypothetical protein
VRKRGKKRAEGGGGGGGGGTGGLGVAQEQAVVQGWHREKRRREGDEMPATTSERKGEGRLVAYYWYCSCSSRARLAALNS